MHHPLKWGIDLDGCLANFNRGFAERLRAKGVKLPTFTATWPEVWDWPHVYATPEQVEATWKEVWDSAVFWKNLRPLPEVGVSGVIERLWDLEQNGHELYFLTHRQGKRVHAQSVEWLKYHLGIRHPQVLIVPGSKAKVAKELQLDVALDDMPAVAEEYAILAEWRPTFRPFLLARPYNAHVTHGLINRVATVDQVIQVVMGTAAQEAMVVS